ncbi:hypothetical protein H7200_00335 [Candidatus Saccharibacteria bacterium]|nr:hypothetical protein [Candidatus Saccharibacteria bacterium]
MLQQSPEVNNNFRGDAVLENPVELFDNAAGPTTSDVIILGEDLHQMNQYEHFYGPRDATNESRGLRESQSRNLAEIAVMDMASYDGQRARIIKLVKEDVSLGRLRLGAEFPTLNVDEQVEAFVSTHTRQHLSPKETVEARIQAEKEQQRLGALGPEKELQEEVHQLRKLIAKQGNRVLTVRGMLVDRGASEEFMREFDYTTKLMTVPELEAYEHEKKLTPDTDSAPLYTFEELKGFQKFIGAIATITTFGGLRNIRLVGPQSAPVVVIHTEKTPQ